MGGMSRPDIRQWQPGPAAGQEPDLAAWLVLVARGDHRAFELVYGELAGPVYGVVRQVLRNPAQSEEVAQEVLRHLQHCPSCEAEVRGLRETAARLAMARALQPPPGMEQRVLAAAYRTRQLLPPTPASRRPGRGRAEASPSSPPLPCGKPSSPPPG